MTAPYQELAKREKIRSDKLAADAKDVGSSAISRTMASAAKLAVEAAMSDSGKGAISEPASDVRAIRSNPHLVNAKMKDLNSARTAANKEILAAIQDGYEYDATERAKVVVQESIHLKITVDVSKQELADLQSFPIQGLTAQEWTQRLIFLLSSGIDETLAKPLTNAFPLRLLPVQLQAQAEAHGGRLAQTVSEAFYAGTKAAMLALREAMSAP